ncbi:hypothetical protein [Herbidospora cretacea]|uniref:hypothetical protein n=1 Tax=Herbidospora cretacea TaxID=28444 RepID=UPI0009EEE789|nr:hypothetical protein [Herbidospora cretacea]
MLDHVVYAEGRQDAWEKECEAMRSRHAFWPTGVTGAVRDVLPDTARSDDHVVASVYAEFVRAQGWLRTDRLLTAGEYASMRGALALRGGDRTLSDVRDRFGPPSALFGPRDPRHGKTLGYATGDPADPMVFFHFWNGDDSAYEEAVLLAARCGAGTFRDTFTLTPAGERRRTLQLP